MKIRNGFVSNSSSSSFVVFFPREPKNYQEVKEILFDKDDRYYSPYNDDVYSSDTVANRVWEDIKKQKKNDFVNAKELILWGGTLEGYDAPNFEDFSHIKDNVKQWKAYDNARQKYAEKKVKEFLNIRKLKLDKIEGKNDESIVLYTFEYSDNSGDMGAAMEHGNLFRKLKHLKINNH